ncbi:MAG TPA: hypothetical protein ENL08_02900, partial [Bacteroidetes bacterium]|nr:hypothetical protein [Bacteroidota bacterium]
MDSWTSAYSGSVFDSPTDIQVLENAAGEVFLFICDTGNDRVIVWHDSDAEPGGNSTAAPAFVTAFGGEGAAFGAFMNPTGVSAVQNGADFDVYVSDRDRGIVAKYQLGEAPRVDVDWTVISDYGYLPAGSFTFTKESGNAYMSIGAQEGSTIRFFYSDTTAAGQGDPLPCSDESFPYSTTSWTWTFSETPGGTPADGVYYLYARLYDTNGVFLDEDRSPEGSLFRIDSELETGLGAYDTFDGDRYLYLQNLSERVIDLDVIYPDSVVAVGLSGTFPANLMQIVSIEAGPAWETIQHQNLIFSWDTDADAGTWELQASVTGSNTGLVSGQPRFTIARATVLVNEDAITTDSRVQNGAFDLTSGTWVDYKGEVLPDPGLNDLYFRIAYLGDIATSVADAGSPPHMIPVPDGNMDIEDITVFTMGWNGIGGIQDPICDFAPYQGVIPNLRPTPDGVIGTEELLGFTLMLGWFQANLTPTAAVSPGNSPNEDVKSRGTLDLDAEHLAMVVREEGNQRIVEIHANDVEQLMSAQLTIHFNPVDF